MERGIPLHQKTHVDIDGTAVTPADVDVARMTIDAASRS